MININEGYWEAAVIKNKAVTIESYFEDMKQFSFKLFWKIKLWRNKVILWN